MLFDFLRGVRERPVWRPPPRCLVERDEVLPRTPAPLAEIWRFLQEEVLPFPTGNIHPRFFGWVHGSGTIGGVVAELIAAAMNSNLAGRDHAPRYIERQVVRWMIRLFGFPTDASGILLSGTSMATILGLTIARHRIDPAIKQRGLFTTDQLVAYASSEVHVSVRKALALIGLGSDALRKIPVDANFQIDCQALERAIAADRAAGLRPFCIVGTAGTVNTGAIDDLVALGSLAEREQLWLHVDGAFGALLALSPRLRPRVAGIERADSLAFDFHKWLHVPYSAGCLLVRDERLHRETFSTSADYLAASSAPQRGLAGGAPWPAEYGPELSRGFIALKVWLTLKEQGSERLAAAIERNCAQAAYLADLIRARPELALLAPVPLNVVCYRFIVKGLDAAALDKLNADLVAELQESGIAAPSTTKIGGALAIRVAITNHRTRIADLDQLVDATVEIGRRRSNLPGLESDR